MDGCLVALCGYVGRAGRPDGDDSCVCAAAAASACERKLRGSSIGGAVDIAARACWREMTYGQFVFVDGTCTFLASIRGNIIAVVSAPLLRGASAMTSSASCTLDPFQSVLPALLYGCRCGGDARLLVVGQLVPGMMVGGRCERCA